jgi:ABC-type proline/glycine betaine transport system permease subunit
MGLQYSTAMAVLVGLQTTPLNLSHFTVGITIALLQTVPSLAVLTTASWLSVFDSTADCCLRRLAH